MSIARLKKITLLAALGEKQAILEGLQGLGCMHLTPLRTPPADREKEASPRAEAAYAALRFLKDVARKRRPVLRDPEFDVDRLVERTLDLKQRLRAATDRRDFLVQRIAAIEPWGDLEFPPHETLAGYRLWFYVLPLRHRYFLQSVELPWQIVREDRRFAFAVLIAKEEPPSDLLPVPRTHVGALPLAELKAQLEDVEVELEDLTAERHALTRFIYLLSLNLAEADNRASLSFAAQQTRDDDAIVAVQGWVPVDAVGLVEGYAQESGLACLIEDPGPDDSPPTLIEQPQRMQAGVDLSNFYQVPAYRSWDPSVLLFASFSLFFAMILADAGYGMVLLGGLLAFWRKLGRSAERRAYRLLGLSLCACAILYGAVVGSYFGITPDSGSTLAEIHLVDLDDFETMMRLSIIIGVIHIGLANAMLAYARRRQTVALSNLGWIGACTGGMTLWLSQDGGGWRTASLALLAVSAIAIVLFSSQRPVHRTRDRIWRLTDGLMSLKGAMNAFADILSYLRLFALGLASASLAMTFNELAQGALESLPGLGLLAALLILIVGHALNLGLSLISGIVHGLRLNFIEFFNWGFPEEGTAFRRFARKEVVP